MWVRAAEAGDMEALAEVFFVAVREGAAPAYDAAQRAAWAGAQPTAEQWAERLAGLETVVAEDSGVVVGFMSVRASDGDLDLAFVRPEVRGTGVAAALYAALENRMRVAGVARLHTRASHMAKPFFERQGWAVVRPNTVTRAGQTLDNWVMEKTLRRG